MTSSAFVPCQKKTYEVIEGSDDDFKLMFKRLIAESNCPSSQRSDVVSKSPQKRNPKRKTDIKRKKWSEESKLKAITVGNQMGLSRATRFLQQTEEFKELKTSTLYYWMKSSEK